MAKIIKKITFLSLVTFFCTKIYSNSYEIVVDVSEQRLYLKQFSKIVESFPISTSKYGEGSTENSFKTPLGASRILWLSGLESGINSGPGVDSYSRYIYIHGTHEEGLIGQKASHGCIRMFNNDVVYLYDIVEKGTKVYIRT
jgi:lipoprotein-anchoring transpeptidase ErfK/SrfK